MVTKQITRSGMCVTLLIIIISLKLVLSEAEIFSNSIETGRSLLQTQDVSSTIYQQNEIVRIDPLDQFNKYKGSYNITNMHYWSSTIFTGIYGYAIALLWLIAGIVYAMYLLTASCCRTNNQQLKRRTPCHKPCYLFPIILSTIFAILAIIASGVALEANMRFHSRAKTIMSVVIKTADQASNTIYNATGPMRKISANLQRQATDSVNGVDGADAADIAGAASFMASTSDKLDYAATGIERQAQKNRHLVERGLTILNILTIITISLNLAVIIALTVFGILRLRRALHMLIIFGWLLTAICWLFFGSYFVLEKFSTDTCTALQDFRHNPDNSSLSSILPCDEFLSARTILSDVGLGIYEIVDQVNTNITLLRSNSFPGLEYVCNPFSGPPEYLYQPGNCAADTITIGDIPQVRQGQLLPLNKNSILTRSGGLKRASFLQVLKMFTCSENSGTSCQTAGIITTSEYNVIEAYTTSIQSLLNAYPDMKNLVDCQLVKDASSKILVNHCKPLKKCAQTTWISMLVLSVVMVILVPIWANFGHHEQKHHSANNVVQPNTAEANNLDPEAAKAAFELSSVT
ncbi:uncharacterized protein LOC104888858 isoform X3 [Beta vulgaris subsp. vulgaris]|uniref:uncharacterized protein LOC104888858 isoform X3 n=1 Tax=Beta vulgaris subsp. vulgaris TaxID=3555 RepID=UPI00053F95DA|nr:uncharacterized protein LOC104888858 isoform X3 [Beta vulgaris subsp. vulgaris]